MSNDPHLVSRRRFIQGGAALAVLADWRTGMAHLNLQLKSGPGWVALHRSGELVFELRTDWFAGDASLWAEHAGGQITFGLESSRHIGLDAVADATFELWENSFGIEAAVHHHGLGLLFQGYAEDWLGKRGLNAYLRSPITVLDHDDASIIVSPGPVMLSKTRLRFLGETKLHLPKIGVNLLASNTELHLPYGRQEDTVEGLRTAIVFERGQQRWVIDPPRGKWSFEDPAELFQHALFEAEENHDGSRHHRVLFSSPRERVFRLLPDTPLYGTDEQPLDLPMQEPRYLLDLTAGTRLMEAQLAETQVLRFGPLQLILSPPRGHSALQAGDKGCCVVAEAGLTGPIDTALIMHNPKPGAWNVAVLSDDGKNVAKYAQATLLMRNKEPVLEGALNFRILRPQDALDLCFRITNVTLRLGAGNVGWLNVAHNSAKADFSLLIADLPPQAMIRRAIECSGTDATDDCKTNCTGGIRHSRLAAPSRISMVFLMPGDSRSLDLETLLQWARYPLHLSPRAVKIPTAEDMDPAVAMDSVTEIIAPAGLSISPNEEHAFFASNGLRSDNGVNQIWTARLSKRLPAAPQASADHAETHFPVTPDRRPSLRPIVARKLDPNEYILDPSNLKTIVKKLAEGSADARHCVLSPSHGAWLDFGAVWTPEDNTSSFHEKLVGLLEGAVEFTYEGWLVPSGHRVKIVKSGKLQWCRGADRDGVPVLVADFVARYKIVYREPRLVDYEELRRLLAKTPTALLLPFKSITLVGKETPYLDFKPAEDFSKSCSPGPANVYDYWTWILPNGAPAHEPFPFQVEVVDCAGVKHRTTMQMTVGCFNDAYHTSYAGKITSAYNFLSTTPSAMVNPHLNFRGERIAYATPTKMGNTSYPTVEMVLNATVVPDSADAKARNSIPWYPTMVSSGIILEQVNAFSDPNSVQKNITPFEYAKIYKEEPFDVLAALPPTPAPPTPSKNRGEVVLSLAKNSTPVRMNFNGTLGGGLAMPTTDVVALGRKTGTIFASVKENVANVLPGDIEQALVKIGQDGMSVSQMFGELGTAASLLGAVKLSEVLETVSDGIAQAAQLPLLAVKQLHELEQATIGKLQQELQPLIDFRDQAQDFYNNFKNAVEQLQTDLRNIIQASASLVRVIATEQQPADIDFLRGQKFDPSLAKMNDGLAAKMKFSMVERIQQANTWPPTNNGSPVLPTLLQLRDYALNQLLVTPAQNFADALDQAIAANAAEFQKELDQASVLAGQAVGALADSLIFRFVDGVKELLSAVQALNVESAITSFEQIADVAAAIPTLDTAVANLKENLTKNLCITAGKVNLKSLQVRTKAVTDAVNAAGAQIPATLKNKLVAELQSNGAVEAACASIFQKLQAIQDQVNSKITAMVAKQEELRKQFADKLDKIQGAINQARALLTLPKHVNVTYDYKTPLQNAGPFLAEFKGKRAEFNLHSNVLLNLDGTSPTFSIDAQVTNFQLNLIPAFPFVIIGFDKASFKSLNGSAPTVSCPITPENVKLVGPLDFVSDLSKTLKLPEWLIVQITPAGVLAGLNIQLPKVTCGAFNIVGLSVYTAVKLSFTGQPLRMIFGFSNPNQHFTMTYLFLGGGGFINLEFAPFDQSEGMASAGMVVTGALEFGAMAALDFGVANGEVHIFGGFYMSIRPNDVLLSGYYRTGGEFDVLGLISASIEFIMSLSYENRGGEAWLSGDCEVDIDVHVLFFSTTVQLHMHHDFSGRSGN